MLKKRNAQGISIRVIIIAVIALIVLVVLIAMFTEKFGIFSSETTKILEKYVPGLGLGGEEEDKGTETCCSVCFNSLSECQNKCTDTTSKNTCRTACVAPFDSCEKTCPERC